MDHRSLVSFARKTFLAFMTGTMLLAGPLADIAFAQPKEVPGKGAGGGAPTMITGNAPEALSSAYNNVMTELTRAGVVAFMNALQVFFGQLAYDAADYIASGGNGQSAVFYKKGFGEYIKDVASDSAGEFMGSLSNGQFFQHAGFNLCQPKDPMTLLKLQFSLGNFFPSAEGRFTRPKPKCDFKTVIANWDTVAETLSNEDVFSNIQTNFNTNSNDLGLAASVFNYQLFKVGQDVTGKDKERSEGGGFKAITDSISGRVKTPGQVVSEATKDEVVRAPKASQMQVTGAILQNAFEQGPIQLAAYTTSVFLNTLGSKMMKRIFEKGLDAFDFSDLQTKTASIGPDNIVTQSNTDARKANIDLRNPRLQSVATFEVLSELRACPSTNRGLWNCVMDQAMAQAVQPQGEQGGMTVSEALDRGFLHADWKLIPEALHKENRDPLCYTYAYCVGNLQKLRLSRILPVGFEFAAASSENVERCSSAGGCVSLREVVDGFNKCSATGGRDALHPWCHLIDPNWVLTSAPQQCALMGYGESLLSNDLPQRKQECQDVQTCLKRNDRGECVGGYGYCMAEKTVYRFSADECPARYASCRQYTTRAAQQVGYLRNTLDYGQCSADSVGCLWYATTRQATTTDTDVWIGTTSTGPRMYFDKTLETCAANDDGCTKLYRGVTGQPALNLILNPSFEQVATDTQASLLAWTPLTPQTTSTVTSGTASLYGSSAQEFLNTPATPLLSQTVSIVGHRTYTLSTYVRLTSDLVGGVWRGTVRQYNAAGVEIVPAAQDFRSSGCTVRPDFLPELAATSTLNSGWQRFQCSFLAATNAASLRLTISARAVRMDGIQLEESEFATTFVDGINTNLQQVHLKLPPEELGCTGASTDSPLCGRYAKMCSQLDAGCDGYTDTAGGAEIPGVLSTNDLCPLSCVGYAEYRKQRSAFDYIHDVDPRLDDPADTTSSYFIPQSAVQCTQADVGCEEFTNVSASGTDAEKKAYFSYARSCEKPDENTQTYFTWEGSDVTGFQLRTWSLKKEVGTSPAPRVIMKLGPDQSTIKEPSACNEASWRSGVDADCRQFYNAAGSVFYVYYSQTVLSTNDCTTYRLNRVHQADCEKTGGNYNVTSGECFYQIFEPESHSCTAAAVGCRAFAGAGAGNVLTLLSADFRNSTSSFVGGALSTEALLVGDSSLRLNPTTVAGSSVFTTAVSVTTTRAALLRVSFWAKAPGGTMTTLSLQTSATPTGPKSTVGSVTVSSDWRRYTIGLFNGASSTQTVLTWTAPVGRSGGSLFLDEVNVTRMSDIVYVREGSWTTPQECDQTNYGIVQPQAMLGCRQYKNRRNEVSNVRQFSRLCKQELIGCTGFVDTRNSDAVGAQTFVQADRTPIAGFGSATTIRPADRYVYAIDEPSKRCTASADSCRAFGLPQYSVDRQSVQRFTTVYFKDDVTKYGDALCKPSELFCEGFTHGAATEYFRDPQNHTCEYKENISVVGGVVPGVATGTYAGWFRTGTTVPCYPTALESGSTFNVLRTADSQYAGYGATCGEESGECTEFRDTNDRSDALNPSGKPYFFLRNDKLDTSSCAGNVDIGKGCVLLRDVGDSTLRYNTAASYQRYEENNFRPVSPLNCQSDPTNPLCVSRVTGHCVGMARATNAAGATLPVSDPPSMSDLPACRVNADCNVSRPVRTDRVHVYTGTCELDSNDANTLLKVKMDRDCNEWLGCQSSETVFDPSSNRYKDVCTNLALCDKSSGAAGDSFCSHYVKRSDVSVEPILTAGSYFDMNRYVKRAVGLGQRDYSGYTIPNGFQVPDLSSTRVAMEGLTKRADISRFALDYRLAATAMIPRVRATPTTCSYPTPNDTQARILCSNATMVSEGLCSSISDVAASYPDLKLCQHSNGRIGFYRQTDKENGFSACAPITCYLPVHGEDDTVDFNKLTQKFIADNPTADPVLSEAFPPPECRANPEADSPYPTSFVEKWDTSKNPPAPQKKVEGYENAKTCEFGEDCACTYKRVTYPTSAVTKFYGLYSENVPPGVCQGGPRDGQSCIPETIFKAPSQNEVKTADGKTQVTAIEGSNASQSCGPVEGGGHCVALSKIELIRGYFGQCLEHDSTRAVGVDAAHNPCLTWNPTPILFGDKDVYHFVPTAGYLPPENAGQYYCTSYARKPKTIRLNSYYFVGGPVAGGMSKIDYDDAYVSDGDCTACSGNKRGATLDGGEVKGSPTADQCEYTDDNQDDDDQDTDGNALRLVGTGRSLSTSYTETFFKVKSDVLGSAFFKLNPASTTKEQVFNAALDSNFGFMTVQPIRNPNGNGRLACGYQADWVDGLGSFDYDKVDEEKQHDDQWHQKFDAIYKPTLTRGSEKLFTLGDSHPAEVPCVKTNEKDPDWDKCYLKFWETSYRMPNDSDAAFRSLTNEAGTDVVQGLEGIRVSPYYNECKSDKPYFGIRAVFQASADRDAQAGLVRTEINQDNVQGPWRFVGFWVTACAAKTNDYRYIYMNVDLTSADICRELSEVRSRDSRQDAAFTDRVWSQGGFVLPGVGFQYGSRFSPFASALNTKPAGKDPLFQTGNSVAGFSPLSPPTFLSSGVDTYYRPTPNPKDKWAYLSNIFARIYRIYRFSEQSVSKGDTACLSGPFKGQKCSRPLVSNGRGGTTTSPGSPQCNPNGTCKPGELSADDMKQLSLCNSLSGANAGLSCSSRTDICHSAAVDPRNNTALRLPCEVQTVVVGGARLPAWEKRNGYWKHIRDSTGGTPSDASTDYSQQLAANTGAFGCPNTWYSIRQSAASGNTKCSAPMPNSPECPMLVIGRCVKPGGAGPGLVPGKCQMRLPTLTGFGEYMWPKMPDLHINGDVSGGHMADVPGSITLPETLVRTNPLGDSNANFQWVTATSSPSCYVDTDCEFTTKQFYLKGPFSYAGDTPTTAGPLYSARSWHSQIDGTGCTGDACLNLTRFINLGEEGSGGERNFGYGYRGHLTGVWNTFYVAPKQRVGISYPSGWVDYVLGGAQQDDPDPRHPTHRNHLVDELSRWPGSGLSYNRTTEAELLAAVTVASIPGLGDFLDFIGISTPGSYDYYNLAACEPATNFPQSYIGKCSGGLKDGSPCALEGSYTCRGGDNDGGPCRVASDCPGAGGRCDTSAWAHLASRNPSDQYSCSVLPVGDTRATEATNSCAPVSCSPSSPCPGGVTTGPVSACANPSGRGDVNSDNPDLDNNVCTHSAGYYPRLDLCPDPTDEFCGLMSYNVSDRAAGHSMDPGSNNPLPTDVTPGHYQPSALGFSAPATLFNYISYYKPQPPRVAAPDTRNCPTPGQCPIQKTDAFSFNGQSEGIINVAGGQHKSTIQFYGWAAHNQMPLRAVTVDWGDNYKQSLPDARLKNHKPFCGVQGECSDPIKGLGLTCQTDSDCPSGAGVCKPVGTCSKDAGHVCRTDAECTVGEQKDKCLFRTFFGNTPEACEANYFEFSHVYSCNGAASVNNVTCAAPGGSEARCSRDPSRSCGPSAPCAPGDSCVSTGLAPPGGCWDPATNSCRFTPRVFTQDNWGWCTGECRTVAPTETTLVDSASTLVKHNYGGCYAGNTQGSGAQNVRRNDVPITRSEDMDGAPLLATSECSQINPGRGSASNLRPWIVYPGALYLRAGGDR